MFGDDWTGIQVGRLLPFFLVFWTCRLGIGRVCDLASLIAGCDWFFSECDFRERPRIKIEASDSQFMPASFTTCGRTRSHAWHPAPSC
ncbi:hypothetical protein F4859DRAFT_464420 [Xylaria cf. heliscus]|nr:hypothetical protein F4859DRAFT_464420 [Xylaria cf. heliscus]